MKAFFTKVKSTPLSSVIQEKIKDYIRKNALTPGAKLPTEVELAEKTGVSRTAVREALRGLEAIGMIEVQRGSGRYLKDFDFSNLIGGLAYSLVLDSESLTDLLEVRMVLEIYFIIQAIPLITEKDLLELGNIITRIKKKITQKKSFVKEDMEFHQVLFRRVNNQILQKMLEIFWNLFSETLSEGLKLPLDEQVVLHHHLDLLEAARNRDIAQATVSVQRHFDDVLERLRNLSKQEQRLSHRSDSGGDVQKSFEFN